MFHRQSKHYHSNNTNDHFDTSCKLYFCIFISTSEIYTIITPIPFSNNLIAWNNALGVLVFFNNSVGSDNFTLADSKFLIVFSHVVIAAFFATNTVSFSNSVISFLRLSISSFLYVIAPSFALTLFSTIVTAVFALSRAVVAVVTAVDALFTSVVFVAINASIEAVSLPCPANTAFSFSKSAN